MQTCDPLTARWWFNLRTPSNWAIAITVFFWLVVLLDTFIPFLITVVIAMCLAFCLFFYVLEKRAIGIICPHCNEHIETNTPWICGNRQCRNDHADAFPFISRCEHCSYSPKAYMCHHCNELIFFTKDKQTINYAKCVNLPEKLKSQPARRDPIEEKNARHQEEKSDLIHELEITRLKGDLKDAKSKIEPITQKSTRERLKNKYLSQTELDDEIRTLKAQIDEEFKDDPVEREKRHRMLESEARDLL